MYRPQTRAVLWVFILTACLVSYMLRVNMSINLIAMVEPHASAAARTADGQDNATIVPRQIQSECLAINNHENESETHERLTSLPDYGPRYEWDPKVQGIILGSFFWGYMVSSMPGGLLAEIVGPKRIVGISAFLSGILTLLTPLAASWHYGYVIAIRIILGVLGGVVYPALHSLISRWAPPVEKGKFIGALMGGTLGTVITWPLLGAVTEKWGWTWAFFVPGITALLWCLLWFYFVSDTPDAHPRITDKEKFYIIKSMSEGTNPPTKRIPPYKQIFLSIPFWALTILHFGNLWGLYLLLTAGPKYMSEVLGFNLGHSGILAALPYLARMIFGLIFGSIGDYIRKTNWMSVTAIRKSFIVFSHVIPGCFLIGQTLIGCDQTLAVVFLTLALGMNGASTVTNLQNAQDLSSNYAGTVYGIVNCIGGTTGFITPMLTGFITEQRNGLFEWHTIFWIGASVYITCGFIFVAFGRGETQPWNSSPSSSPADGVTQQGIANAAYVGDHGINDDEQRTKV